MILKSLVGYFDDFMLVYIYIFFKSLVVNVDDLVLVIFFEILNWLF